MSDIMTVQGLNLWYGDHQALHDISMNIPEKSITALIGPSGCGKSTFLKTLNRMNDLIPGVKITGVFCKSFTSVSFIVLLVLITLLSILLFYGNIKLFSLRLNFDIIVQVSYVALNNLTFEKLSICLALPSRRRIV